MRLLYIGHYNIGSTSRMRGESIKKIFNIENSTTINIDIPIQATLRIFRTLGWRFKFGPFIKNINKYILEIISKHDQFDLAWIDKGVFIQPDVVRKIREKSAIFVHFTPDPAFTYHQSKLFYQAIPYYDHCITTKSFELASYKAHQAKSTIFCTQGYDPEIHKSYHNFEDKRGVVFIGHKEEDREEAISLLIENGIPFKLAGINWGNLVRRYQSYPNFEYYGPGVFGEEYAKIISGSLIGMGFLSKIIPEKHTTRTFEIPACGTALATERNEEIEAIFNSDEAIFFQDCTDMVQKIVTAYHQPQYLSAITMNGAQKIVQGAYSYEAILKDILVKINIINK